jgi:hypothetical protein
MTLQSVFVFFGLTLALSIAAHWFVRGYSLAVLISITAASLANIAHEAYFHDFQVRPADVVFWIPMELFQGLLLALPIAALVGIPFFVVRRIKQSNGAQR